MTRYFLMSDWDVLLAWKDGDTKLWATEDPVWTDSRLTHTLKRLEDAGLESLTEAEVKEITGELPTWQNIF